MVSALPEAGLGRDSYIFQFQFDGVVVVKDVHDKCRHVAGSSLTRYAHETIVPGAVRQEEKALNVAPCCIFGEQSGLAAGSARYESPGSTCCQVSMLLMVVAHTARTADMREVYMPIAEVLLQLRADSVCWAIGGRAAPGRILHCCRQSPPGSPTPRASTPPGCIISAVQFRCARLRVLACTGLVTPCSHIST